MQKTRICLPSKSNSTLVCPSHQLHFEDGVKTDQLNVLECQEDQDFTVSNQFNIDLESKVRNHCRKRKRECVTQGSQVQSSKKTSKGKFKSSKSNIQPTKSSLTLDPASTSNERVLQPFWNECTKDWSAKLSSCTKTGCVDMELKSSNLSLRKLARNSWFTVKATSMPPPKRSSPKISSPLSTSLWQRITDFDRQKTAVGAKGKRSRNTKQSTSSTKKQSKQVAEKCRRIRVFPTQVQKSVLKKWFGTVRWTYNQAVSQIKLNRKSHTKTTIKELRTQYCNRPALKAKGCDWAFDVPYDVRDEALRDLVKGVKSNFAAKRSHFSFRYRSRKDRQESIVLHSKHFNHSRGVYSSIWSKSALRTKSNDPLPDKISYDCRLVRTRLGQYFVSIPCPLGPRSDNQAPVVREDTHGIVSMDPGVRTFMTCYESSGFVTEWGVNDMRAIFRVCHHSDKLLGLAAKCTNKNKARRLRRASLRVNRRVRNMITDIHHKLAKYLCENFRVVILPEFKVKSMVRRGKTSLHSKVARGMVTWSHYKFRQILLAKSREYPWCHVVIGTEEFTSKTCGTCGLVNRKLGSSKTFHCGSCGYVADRDMNGARNILLLQLSTMTTEAPSGAIVA